MYHPLEVAEAEPTEAEDVEEVEEDNAGSLVAIKTEIMRRMEQHHQRPGIPTGGTSSNHRAEKLHKTL